MSRNIQWIRPSNKTLKDLFDGAKMLRLTSGEHRIVAERRGAPDGAIVAREVMIEDTACADCSGLMEVNIFAGFVRAGLKVRVSAWGGEVEAVAAEVLAECSTKVIARENSVIYVSSSNVIVEAHDQSIVIVWPGYRPTIRRFDAARVLRSPKTRTTRVPTRAVSMESSMAAA